MPFVVINTVRASAKDLPGILAEVQGLGLGGLRAQSGFKSARLVAAEDGTEAALIIEWDSRDHFVAYRQTEVGRKLVQRAADLHPHISFYDVVEAIDPTS